jgi:hypothetical protein
MKTQASKLLKVAILALGLMVLAPLASFAGVGVSIGVGVAPGPGYAWVPAAYNGYAWAPGYWALPPFVGAAWIGPHWGWYGGHRYFSLGYWGHGVGYGGFRGGHVGGYARGGFGGYHGGFHGGFHGRGHR